MEENTKPPAVRRFAIVVAIVIAIGLAMSAFTLSFAALWDVSDRVWPRNIAALGPIVVDGTIVLATISLVALADSPIRRERTFFWALLSLAAATSVGGNALHAVLPTKDTLDPVLAAVIATIPPAFLLLSTHGLVILIRPRTEQSAEADLRHRNDVQGLDVRVPDADDSASTMSTSSAYIRQAEALKIRHELRTDVPKIAYVLWKKSTEPHVSKREIAAGCNVNHATVDRILRAAGGLDQTPVVTDKTLVEMGA